MHALVSTTFFSALALFAQAAQADWFYQFATFECSVKADFVRVRFLGAYNEDGKNLFDAHLPNAWNPWELLVAADDGRHIKGVKTIHKKCVLSDGKYDVEITAEPCNFDIQGAEFQRYPNT